MNAAKLASVLAYVKILVLTSLMISPTESDVISQTIIKHSDLSKHNE